MSVTPTKAKVQYTLASGSQALPVPFPFIENSHLKIVRRRNNVDTPITSGFVVSGAGMSSGGVIALNGASTITGDRITIIRDVPLNQLTSYAANDRFPASTHERALDKLTMLVQMLEEKLGRTLLFGEGELIGQGYALPASVDRALRVLGFDRDGKVDTTVNIEELRRLIIANPVGGMPDVFDWGTVGTPTGFYDWGTV